METPFNFGKVVVGNEFVNRKKEKLALTQNFKSHINTVLISPRRWGKSSLVENIAKQMGTKDKRYKFCFVDLFSVRSEEEFYRVFATKIIKSTSNKWEEWVENAKSMFRNIVPRFQMGLDPTIDFSISFDREQLKIAQDEILNLPETISKQKKIHLIVCIDEFQNISHFNDSLHMQQRMRSIWQHHQISTYCLYGSKRHMLTDIFENTSMPFYKFGDTIFLNKIEQSEWVEFIMRQFESTRKEINPELASEIAIRMENHPYFVQLYAAYVWKFTRKKCSLKILDHSLNELKSQYSMMFQRELDKLTNKQLNFLHALANGVSQFSSAEVLNKYNFGSQGNVVKIKEALEKKEIIDLWGNEIEFMDPLFKQWFIKDYLRRKP